MDQKGSVAKWRLTLAESLALVVTVVSVTIWIITTFQSKSDAQEWKNAIEGRVGAIEEQLTQMRNNMDGIGKDVSYIRGRLEPK